MFLNLHQSSVVEESWQPSFHSSHKQNMPVSPVLQEILMPLTEEKKHIRKYILYIKLLFMSSILRCHLSNYCLLEQTLLPSSVQPLVSKE